MRQQSMDSKFLAGVTLPSVVDVLTTTTVNIGQLRPSHQEAYPRPILTVLGLLPALKHRHSTAHAKDDGEFGYLSKYKRKLQLRCPIRAEKALSMPSRYIVARHPPSWLQAPTKRIAEHTFDATLKNAGKSVVGLVTGFKADRTINGNTATSGLERAQTKGNPAGFIPQEPGLHPDKSSAL